MTTMISEIYEALKEAGASEETAKRAAQAVIAVEAASGLATKADLAELKADMVKWVAGMLLLQAGLVAALVKLL